jgi:hypothetical protein
MKKIKTAGLAIAITVLGLAMVSLTEQVNAGMEDSMMIQKLTETNIPVTLPLTRGFVDGFEVFYISTEASDQELADHLTKVTGSRVVFAPALQRTPEGSLANIYAFANGIKGTGPLGFQPNVADSQPGDAKYSPLWKVNMVEWGQGVTPRELRSEADILSAQDNNELTITPTKLIVNCPFVKWNGGQLQIRSDKTLTDETPYGGGQVLSIDTEKMQVTFVAHRGFAPDGKTIYYIATDASVKEVADDLGVLFVEKTKPTLTTASASDLFVFTNGIKGTGPMGFQASIASTDVGNAFYSPMWRILVVTWKDVSQAEFLTKQSEIISATSSGKLTSEIAGVVVNCPFVVVSGDKMMDKMMGDKMMKERVFLRGDLTSPEGDNPFGGNNIGTYMLGAKDGNSVRIIARVQTNPSEGNVLEGWLVDMQSGYKLSTGQLSAGNNLIFMQRIVNPWIYDLIVITEEPANDIDPNPQMPIGGVQLSEPFGQ